MERTTGNEINKTLIEDKETGPFKIVNLRVNPKLPSILVRNPENGHPALLLLDSGSEINIIKRNILSPKNNINTDIKIALKGITSTPVKRSGLIQIRMFNHLVDIHVVEQEFGIPYDEILGGDFFNRAGVILDYENEEMVTGRYIVPFFKGNIRNQTSHQKPVEEIHFLGES